MNSKPSPLIESIKDPQTRNSVRHYLTGHVYMDWLKSMGDMFEAVEDYIREVSDDPNGSVLLVGIEELISRQLSEQDLRALIEEEWHCDARSALDGFTWTKRLPEIRDYLRQRKSKHVEN